MPHPLLLIAAIFALSFIIRMIILSEMAPAAPSADESGSIAPAPVPNADANFNVRLAGLRQALDNAGYRSVNFRMNGDVLQLWGTVPDEFDRVNVQTLVFHSVGIVLLEDHLRVHDAFAEP